MLLAIYSVIALSLLGIFLNMCIQTYLMHQMYVKGKYYNDQNYKINDYLYQYMRKREGHFRTITGKGEEE